jgi:hypothetical protein
MKSKIRAKAKVKAIRENLSNDKMAIGKINLALSNFETEHPFKNGLGNNINLTEQELVSLIGQIEMLANYVKSGKKKEQLALEATILKTLSGITKPTQTMAKMDVSVPTIERRFNNIKSFNDMQQEAFVSPLTSIKNKANDDIKNKVNSITNGAEKEKYSEANPRPKTKPKGLPYKSDRRNISALKSEISNKMKELDSVFKQDTQTVISKAEEVKQMLEKLNIMLVKEAHMRKPKAKMIRESKAKSCGTGKCGNCKCKK